METNLENLARKKNRQRRLQKTKVSETSGTWSQQVVVGKLAVKRSRLGKGKVKVV